MSALEGEEIKVEVR